jgi:DNA-binding response OmpR family regulator
MKEFSTLSESARSEEKTRTRCRVLVIDDEEGIRESLRLLLEDDFDVSVAASGEEGLEAAKLERPDAIFWMW